MTGFYFFRSAPSMAYAVFNGSHTQVEFELNEVI